MTKFRNLSCSVVILMIVAVPWISEAGEPKCNGSAQCVPLSECPLLSKQLQQGNTPELTRLLRSLHCGFQDSYPKVCCPPEADGNQANRGGFKGPGGGSIGSEFVHEGHQDQDADSATLLPPTSICGIQDDNRIVGGKNTELDEHPWMALLRYDKPNGGWGFYCGGVLISARYVLTAGHCVKGIDIPVSWRLSQVRLGEWNTSSSTDCLLGECSAKPMDVTIEEIIPHEQYLPNDPNQLNDLALIRLSAPVPFTDYKKAICLPTNEKFIKNSLEGSNMEVAGWGKTETRQESDVKLKVSVPVVSLSECADKYRLQGRSLSRGQLCAGSVPGRDSCRGDSGGPLMGRVGPNWYVFGIVSYGPTPCGSPGWPGVYTRVTQYVDWITSKMRA